MDELTEHELYEKQLWNYLRNSGSKSMSTWAVYKSHLYLILQRFPHPKNATLFEIQSWSAEIENDNTRKNTCVMIRWLFNKVLGWDIKFYELPYPKRKKKIQPIYSQESILKIINAINNEKHKAIIALIADCGLRISEPCSILLSDCFPEERKIILRSAKGDNDRVVYPSEYVWELIKKYQDEWIPKSTRYLFEGQRVGNPYTDTSIRSVLKLYCRITGVEYLGVHAIRRFSGTWWIENDVPITVIANNFGHNGTRTLEKHYAIHSAKYLRSIPSPLQPPT